MVRLIVVHDLLGTLFSLSSPVEELRAIFAEQLRGEGARPILAELVVMDWFHAAQRDFTYSSINDAYQPIADVFKATLPRVFLQAGLLPPDQYQGGSSSNNGALEQAGAGIATPGNENPFPSSITDRMMASLQKLKPRPGMVEAFSTTYRSKELTPKSVDQVELWAATNGGNALADKLLKGALGEGINIYTGAEGSAKQRSEDDIGHGLGLFSCDEIKVAKPHPKVYAAIQERIGAKQQQEEDLSLWFVASHTWDLFAAKKAGFKTAWVGYEEFYTCPDIYGKPDVIATDLEDVAKQILKWEHGRQG